MIVDFIVSFKRLFAGLKGISLADSEKGIVFGSSCLHQNFDLAFAVLEDFESIEETKEKKK